MSRLHELITKIPSSSNSLDFLAPALSPLLPLPQSLPHPCPFFGLPFGLSWGRWSSQLLGLCGEEIPPTVWNGVPWGWAVT